MKSFITILLCVLSVATMKAVIPAKTYTVTVPHEPPTRTNPLNLPPPGRLLGGPQKDQNRTARLEAGSTGSSSQSGVRRESRINSSSTDEIRDYVRSEAIRLDVDPNVALFIVEHESQFDPTKLGDDGQSRGLWQISKIWHPEVSSSCVFDVQCSTYWALKRIHKGYVNEWSTFRFCQKLYSRCPFES